MALQEGMQGSEGSVDLKEGRNVGQLGSVGLQERRYAYVGRNVGQLGSVGLQEGRNVGQ